MSFKFSPCFPAPKQNCPAKFQFRQMPAPACRTLTKFPPPPWGRSPARRGYCPKHPRRGLSTPESAPAIRRIFFHLARVIDNGVLIPRFTMNAFTRPSTTASCRNLPSNEKINVPALRFAAATTDAIRSSASKSAIANTATPAAASKDWIASNWQIKSGGVAGPWALYPATTSHGKCALGVKTNRQIIGAEIFNRPQQRKKKPCAAPTALLSGL